MKDWPYKARDLAIANMIMSHMASLNNGSLRFLEDYREDKKTDTFMFKLPPWVGVLVNAFKALYPQDELIEVVGKVLDEMMRQFNCLSQEDAELFRNLVTLALTNNHPAKTFH